MNVELTETELPVRLRFERPMSDDDLLRFCAVNDVLRVERDASGELILMSPSGLETSRINQRICRFLDEWAEADGRGIVTDSSGGYTLPDGSMRAPDAAWVTSASLNLLTPDERARFAPICPAFVIELRSPSDTLVELNAKMQGWIRNGAMLAWLIDPIERSVTIYRPGDQPERLLEPTSVQGTGIVAGFELLMHRVWG